MLNTRFLECSLCGSSDLLESDRDLIRSVRGTMQTDNDLLNPSLVPRALHAASLLMFGGCRYSCRDCGAVFSSRGESRSGNNDGIATTELEVHLIND